MAFALLKLKPKPSNTFLKGLKTSLQYLLFYRGRERKHNATLK